MNNIIGEKAAKPNESIRTHTDNLINQAKILKNIGYLNNEKLFKDLLTACEYHDYGKANSEFQKRIKFHYHFNPENEIPHNVLSLFFVNANECNDYISVCLAVLYHHYHSSPIDVLRNQEELIRKFLEEIIGSSDIYDEIYDYTYDDIRDLFNKSEDNKQKQYSMLLKGFLHKCDYSASAGITCEYPNDFLIESLEKWKHEKSVELKKNVEFNELQRFCLENTDKDIIVTAPTGMGKTEAGLLWCGNNKCFFVLPLKTAINAMYDRIKKLSGDKYKERVALLHSDMRSYYFNDNAKNESGELDFEYCDKSKQMSLPVTVCTPDQIFDFALKYAGYEYKLATASYSKFIIDEIQMYSPDVLAVIIYAIKMIHNMGGKFAVLTATMPPFVRNELSKIFGKDIAENDFSDYGKLRHNVSVYEKTLNSDDVFETIEKVKSDTVKKFLVVCNSIDTADKIYTELKSMYNETDIEINMFHSKYIKADRAKKEEEILNASKDRTKTEIWISTSVIEASLDIDFDILFTELSDLFSLFQRFGRVNRKGEKNCQKTNCYVFTELQGNAKKYHFTDETIYSFSKQAILTVNGLITEKEKSALIDEYLSVENLKNSKYLKDYKEAFKYIETLYEYESDTSKKIRNIDTVDVIPEPVYEKNKDEILEAIDIISDKNSSKEMKIEKSEFLKKFTVSESKYHAKEAKALEYKRAKSLKIQILGNCSYDFERGIVFNKKAEEKNAHFNFL